MQSVWITWPIVPLEHVADAASVEEIVVVVFLFWKLRFRPIVFYVERARAS